MRIDVTSFMRVAGIVGALLIGGLNAASSQVVINNSDEPSLYTYCQRFQTLYTQIRVQSVTPDSARKQFSQIMGDLQARFRSQETYHQDSLQRDSLRRTGQYFAFPLRGYTTSAIGGTHGEGYRGTGFDLFDYNVRGSHPAQDIFITDRNQDHLDDRTDQPVDILAMSSGLVLAIETAWKPGSEYRGGQLDLGIRSDTTWLILLRS